MRSDSGITPIVMAHACARLRSTVKAAAQVPGKDVARAYLARDRFAGEVNTAFRSIDMLLTPALPEPAPLWTDYDAVLDDMAAIGRRFTRFLSPFNIAHVPAIVFPIGQDGNGVPIAAQLVAAPRSEEHTSELQSLMRISYAVFCLKKKKYT